LGVNPLFAIAQGTMSERLWSVARNLEFRRFFSSFHHSSTPRLWPTGSNSLTDGKYGNNLWRCNIGFISLHSACRP
jgi:hypothetical protein